MGGSGKKEKGGINPNCQDDLSSHAGTWRASGVLIAMRLAREEGKKIVQLIDHKDSPSDSQSRKNFLPGSFIDKNGHHLR